MIRKRFPFVPEVKLILFTLMSVCLPLFQVFMLIAQPQYSKNRTSASLQLGKNRCFPGESFGVGD